MLHFPCISFGQWLLGKVEEFEGQGVAGIAPAGNFINSRQ
jgi:hypothetical protein